MSADPENPKLVWAAFVDRAERAHVLRVFLTFDVVDGGGDTRRWRGMLTLERGGRAAFDVLDRRGDRWRMVGGRKWRTYHGEQVEQSYDARMDAAVMALVFRGLRWFPHEAYTGFPEDKPALAGRVKFAVTLAPGLEGGLGFNGPELVSAWYRERGERPVTARIYRVEVDPVLADDFFERDVPEFDEAMMSGFALFR